MKKLVSTIALVVCCLTLTQCGGGGGGSDDSSGTVRPKTLDGLVLTLDGGKARFEFSRNSGNAGAVANGDVETGGFTYTSTVNSLIQTYDNTAGTRSNLVFPRSVTSPQYSYKAINDTAGVLTLTGVGSSNIIFANFNNLANNDSLMILFESDSRFEDIFEFFFERVENNTVVIDLTFSQSGQLVSSNLATVSQPGGDPRFDTVVMPSAVALASGAPLPINYNPEVDPDQPSKIAPVTLNNRRMSFTNGIPNTSLDFSIQFVSEAQNGGSTDVDEIGQGLLRSSAGPVDNAVDYTYTRINGTDDATLVISGSGTTYDGSYTLRFAGPQSGAYIGTVDAGTANAADVSGKFVVPIGTGGGGNGGR